MTQAEQVKALLQIHIKDEMTDIPRIYNKIELETNIPRSAIRRAKSELVKELESALVILKSLEVKK